MAWQLIYRPEHSTAPVKVRTQDPRLPVASPGPDPVLPNLGGPGPSELAKEQVGGRVPFPGLTESILICCCSVFGGSSLGPLGTELLLRTRSCMFSCVHSFEHIASDGSEVCFCSDSADATQQLPRAVALADASANSEAQVATALEQRTQNRRGDSRASNRAGKLKIANDRLRG